MPFASPHHELTAELQRIFSDPRGALGRLCDAEIALGNVLVPVGSTQPFAVPKADWLPSVVSTRDGEAFLILLDARHPGRGALSRLIQAVFVAGYVPVIVEPMGIMRSVVKRWNWQRSYSGAGFERREEWRPLITS